MRPVRKQIVTDEAMQPIAIQIGYEDWLEIERLLGLQDSSALPTDLSEFSGVLRLTDDPAAFQRQIRG
ncbi:hypothetical protein RAS1_31820 [Phycisphaerae bacterium RAS1]|nr:hypothetical protein RAS1_31820 [Phycisphaerae bacterium RAS1]